MRILRPGFAILVALMLVAGANAQEKRITTPKEQLGANLGDDYFLANYTQLVEYWQKLERESDRVKLENIGKTEEGRDILMAIVTSPENHKNLARYQEIAKKMALAEGLHDDEARALAEEGKAVIWIDGGLHASEVLVAQQLMETVYQLASKQDPETLRILDDVIILCANPNPDGQDLVADWYMREEDEKRRTLQGLPRLYQKYIGHDNNRDFYMVSMKESEALCRIFYRDWFPQIIFNHHQTGPAGTVLFAPPFRGPFNHNFDPLVPLGINAVGAAIHSRFAVEGKPGATMRNGASYSTWWNGGLRTNTYFHNMIGLLTETIGSPTPMEIPLRTQRLLATDDLPFPITPQKWHFRQSLDYSVSSNYAVLDYASRNRSLLLFNIYRMGKNSIERGNRDHWTIRPRQIAAADQQLGSQSPAGNSSEMDLPPGAEQPASSAAQPRTARGQRNAAPGSTAPGSTSQETAANPPAEVPSSAGNENAAREVAVAAPPTPFETHFRDPAARDPRGYILPSDQKDFLTATKFVNTLVKNGITIHRATEWFEVSGKKYPPGSYVVKTAQAFRPHIIDMFEPQDHPDDFPFPGGPPIPPYDSAGWTLAMQMGVQFDRILDGFDGPFERLTGLIPPPAGAVTGVDGAAGFVITHATNDAFVAMNRLLKAGEIVEWYLEDTQAGEKSLPAGTIYIAKQGETAGRLDSIALEVGLNFEGVSEKPAGKTLPMRSVRIGLWDRYGGSMPSGWVRWLLEQYEFDFRLVFPAELDAGDLRKKFDVLLFVDGAIPAFTTGGRGGARGEREPNLSRIPEEYHSWIGSVTAARTIPRLKEFAEDGGTILAIGSSTSLAAHFQLPLENPLVERTADGGTARLGPEKFYVPGSVMEVRVNNQEPLAYGMDEHMNIYFDNSPVFNLLPAANHDQIRPVAWFDSDKSLRSGWAWGQHYLKDRVTIVEAKVGQGRLVLYGPEITYRSQPHASFKFLFNGIYYGPAMSESK